MTVEAFTAMPHISIVAPVFNEARQTLNELVRRVSAALEPITNDYEIILVDDGSRNDAWDVISSLTIANPHVCGIRLARNFGQHVAITAGLDQADGDWVVVMDSDLQDRPEVIPDLYAKAKEGFDIVFVVRQYRPESLTYRIGAACFYGTLNFLSGQEYNRLYGNFSIIAAKVVRAFRSMRESSRFYGGMLAWLGFKQTSIVAVHGSRGAGRTTYNIGRRIRWAFELIVGFSTRLLYMSITAGLLMALASLIMAAFIVTQKILYPHLPVLGWPSVMTAVFFIGGITNVALGLVGIYIGRIFEETKRRPLYVVAEQTKNAELCVAAGDRLERV